MVTNPLNQIHRLLIVMLLSIALAGCAAMAESNDETPSIDAAPIVQSIVFCQTTLADLKKKLGEPTRDGRVHSSRVVSWITAWDPLVRYLGVLLDKDEVVTDLYWNVPSEIQWLPTSQCGS